MEDLKVYGVVKAFTNLTDGKVYQSDEFYKTDDINRAKELLGKENKRGEAMIRKLTKKELLEIAEQHDIEVDSKIKVDELNSLLAGEVK